MVDSVMRNLRQISLQRGDSKFQRTSTITCSCAHSVFTQSWREEVTRRATDLMGLKYERFEAGKQVSKKAGYAMGATGGGGGGVAPTAAAHFYGFPSSHYNMKGISHTLALTLGESHVCFEAGPTPAPRPNGTRRGKLPRRLQLSFHQGVELIPGLNDGSKRGEQTQIWI